MRGCPVATDARGYLIAISRGDYAEGYRISRAPNPFASICGKVCGAPCEITCRRGKVDDPLTIRALKGFLTDAIFIGVGLPDGKRLPLPGADHPDVLDAIAVLHDYCDGRGRDFSGRHTLVIGGGNVAMDISRSLLRINAASVKTVCLERDWEEMPADHDELVDADAEGVEFLPGWGPVEVVIENGKIRGLRCQKLLSVFDDQRRFAPKFDESDQRVIEADTVLFSVGQVSDPTFLDAIDGVTHQRGILQSDPETKQTSLEGVFAGGDVASGPGLFINCIQDGSLGSAGSKTGCSSCSSWPTSS